MSQDFADIIIRGGEILTVDSSQPRADFVAIAGDKIIGVGANGQMDNFVGPETKFVELDGRTAIPGMIDNHTHQLLAGLDSAEAHAKVNIASAQSIAEIKQKIAAEVERVGPGKWIGTSCMFRGALEEGRFPNRKDLDEVAPNNPVYIFQSGKNIIANTAALRLAGISKSTPDPIGDINYSEGHIVRDTDGEPTGHLIAGAGDLARRRWWEALDQPMKKWDFLHFDRETYISALRAQMRVLNSVGITGTRDMGTSEEEMAAYADLAERGEATLRTELIVGLPIRYVNIDESIELIQSYDGPGQGDGNDWYRIGGFKFVLQNDGFWSHSPEKARALILLANRLDWTLAIHGPAMNNQEAWDQLMAVLEEANAQRPLSGRRFSFEHWVGTRRPEHLARLREWGFTVAANPPLSYMGAGRSFRMHQALQEVRIAKASALSPMEHARQEWGLSMRSWIDAGLLVTGGSDCPATTYSIDQPLLGMYAARTQMSLAGELLADQKVTPEEALRMWTLDAAYSMSMEHRVGSIEVGKLADIAILSANPVRAADEEMLDIRVCMTIVGGKVVFQQAESGTKK